MRTSHPSILEVKTKYKGDAAKYVDNYFKKSFLTDQSRYECLYGQSFPESIKQGSLDTRRFWPLRYCMS